MFVCVYESRREFNKTRSPIITLVNYSFVVNACVSFICSLCLRTHREAHITHRHSALPLRNVAHILFRLCVCSTVTSPHVYMTHDVRNNPFANHIQNLYFSYSGLLYITPDSIYAHLRKRKQVINLGILNYISSKEDFGL